MGFFLPPAAFGVLGLGGEDNTTLGGVVDMTGAAESPMASVSVATSQSAHWPPPPPLGASRPHPRQRRAPPARSTGDETRGAILNCCHRSTKTPRPLELASEGPPTQPLRGSGNVRRAPQPPRPEEDKKGGAQLRTSEKHNMSKASQPPTHEASRAGELHQLLATGLLLARGSWRGWVCGA